jgi:hypothetical protein
MKLSASIAIFCLAWSVSLPAAYAESDCINQCNFGIDARTSRPFGACLVGGAGDVTSCPEDDSWGMASWCKSAKEARASCDALKTDCREFCDTKKEWWQIWKK